MYLKIWTNDVIKIAEYSWYKTILDTIKQLKSINCGGIVIKVKGDKAYGKWYIWMTGTQDGTKAFWAGGFYEDEYVKVGGKWLFSRVKANILFLTPYEEGWAKKPFMD